MTSRERVVAVIRGERPDLARVMRLCARRGMLFCTTHFVQEHCSMEELAFAYDTAYRFAREVYR